MALYADFEGLHYPALLSDHGEVEIVGDAGEVERVEASSEDTRRVRTDKILRAALDGLKKRKEHAEAEGK